MQVVNASGCEGLSSIHRVTIHQAPVSPTISQQADTLISTPAAAYQWYFNGTEITGATQRSIAAVDTGYYTVRIIDNNGCFAISVPFEVKKKIEATSTVVLPILEAAPGDRISIPLSLSTSQYLSDVGATTFIAAIEFNKSILIPIGNTPKGYIANNKRILTVQDSRISDAGKLLQLDFLVCLGDEERTLLHIKSFSWNSSRVNTNTIDGEVRLIVCREGGTRLYSTTGRLTLQQNHPNPFNSMTTIEYEVIEKGYTQLYVSDMLGRRVATIVDMEIQPGKYRVTFDASNLSSGIYFYILQTPTQMLYQVMRLMK